MIRPLLLLVPNIYASTVYENHAIHSFNGIRTATLKFNLEVLT